MLGEGAEAGPGRGCGRGPVHEKNSRDHEFQADEFGVMHAVQAGYDPYGMVRFFDKLVAMHGSSGGGFAGWLSTHPDTNERIARAREEIATYDLTNHPMNRNTSTYQSRTASLPSGS